MKPTVEKWKIAIIGIDAVFLMVAFDLLWLHFSTPPGHRSTRTFILNSVQYFVGYLGLRVVAMAERKKISLSDASTQRE